MKTQIPLVVSPSELGRPSTPSFTLARLPAELSKDLLEESIADANDALRMCRKLAADVAGIEERKAPFEAWKKQAIRKVAPGYLDNGLHIMSPTRRGESEVKEEEKVEEFEEKDQALNGLEQLIANARIS
ncbi:unnamed protein product [Kuraishia capsulata CBS 1993]|uniref:Uncharacterized protein n=1 Tax=Kuraishia capsulata CBS 1993 TaxID=1382522 RepID=W6MY09_9ASCO|nr:uncharacterized protein KUCA_T00005808001 [Kuraishia capsulata CBS 1993]CDK29815.1 unnamed protein product [Kuraishia capsulata CBS 1993]